MHPIVLYHIAVINKETIKGIEDKRQKILMVLEREVQFSHENQNAIHANVEKITAIPTMNAQDGASMQLK